MESQAPTATQQSDDEEDSVTEKEASSEDCEEASTKVEYVKVRSTSIPARSDECDVYLESHIPYDAIKTYLNEEFQYTDMYYQNSPLLQAVREVSERIHGGGKYVRRTRHDQQMSEGFLRRLSRSCGVCNCRHCPSERSLKMLIDSSNDLSSICAMLEIACTSVELTQDPLYVSVAIIKAASRNVSLRKDSPVHARMLRFLLMFHYGDPEDDPKTILFTWLDIYSEGLKMLLPPAVPIHVYSCKLKNIKLAIKPMSKDINEFLRRTAIKPFPEMVQWAVITEPMDATYYNQIMLRYKSYFLYDFYDRCLLEEDLQAKIMLLFRSTTMQDH